MAISRWTPMGNLASFQHEMNRVFNDVFRGGNSEERQPGEKLERSPEPLHDGIKLSELLLSF